MRKKWNELTEAEREKKKQQNKDWFLKNRKHRQQYDKQRPNKNERLEHIKKYNKEHRKERYAYYKEWLREISLEKKREYYHKHAAQQKARNAILKKEIMMHYGNSVCSCCGEHRIEFLTIDHINGGGTKHRILLKGKSIYKWLKDNNYPDGFRVLCMNCNFAMRNGEICPHKKEGTKD